MTKTILITGSTDGIGLETAKMLLKQGHHILLHGRNAEKLGKVKEELSALGEVESFVADLSDLKEVKELAQNIKENHLSLDVLINNAGVLKSNEPLTKDGIDIRFVVNSIAPYLLTKELLPILNKHSRVINLSSAAQAPIDLDALTGKGDELETMSAYSQSKLAIVMWANSLHNSFTNNGPTIISVNPGSMLASKMVKEYFKTAGKDLAIGADILMRAALSDEFLNAGGKYFDNDSKQFANPHPDALDQQKCASVVSSLEFVISKIFRL
ncbi:MAG: hypothetical protein DGJ47_000681 [Rickettsiaceae bacterium]